MAPEVLNDLRQFTKSLCEISKLTQKFDLSNSEHIIPNPPPTSSIVLFLILGNLDRR